VCGRPRYVRHPVGKVSQKRSQKYTLDDQPTTAQRREVEQGDLFLAFISNT
jgi:hypothetical protein